MKSELRLYGHILGNPNLIKVKKNWKDAGIYGWIELLKEPLKNNTKSKKEFAKKIGIGIESLNKALLRLEKEKYIKISNPEIALLPFSSLHKKYMKDFSKILEEGRNQ